MLTDKSKTVFPEDFLTEFIEVHGSGLELGHHSLDGEEILKLEIAWGIEQESILTDDVPEDVPA